MKETMPRSKLGTRRCEQIEAALRKTLPQFSYQRLQRRIDAFRTLRENGV